MSDPTPHPATPVTADAPPAARFEWKQSPFENFLENHFPKLVAALVIGAVGVGGWLVFRQKSEEKRTQQAEAFTSSETLDDYKKIIANYPGTPAAGSAQLMIANLLAQNNDIPGALEELQKFISTYPSHPLADQAAFRVAILTLEKDGAEAGIAKLDEFISKYPQSPVRWLAQMRKGDALAAKGDREKAAELFSAMLKDSGFAGNTLFQKVEERLAQVKLQPPVEVEFVPEPTPDPAAAAPGAPNASAPLMIPPVPAAAPEITAPALNLEVPAQPEPAAETPAPAPEEAAPEAPAPASETPAPAPAETPAEAPAAQ